MAAAGGGFVKTFKRHIVTIIILAITVLFLAFEFAVPFIFKGTFCPSTTSASEDVCSNGTFWLHMCPFFIVSVLTLIALIIGLCQKVVGIILDIIAALLHIGVIVYYVLFIIKGTNYSTIMRENVVLQAVPPIALSLATVACIVCMFDCCRHVYATKFGGGKGGSGDSSADYVPLQGSKSIDSDSDDSD